MSSTSGIPQRKLGRNGPLVAEIGLGCMGMSPGIYSGGNDDDESRRTLERAVELGCTFWDTADVYGFSHNETLIGPVLRKYRDRVFICTKFAMRIDDPSLGWAGVKVCGEPAYVKEACAHSLQRLGVDCIDLYYQHRVDKNVPIEDTVKAMAELVKEGKVKYLGLSECSGATLRRAHAVHPISAVQVEWSPWTLDLEKNGLLDTCRELGVSVVAYSPLGRGMLTGTFAKPEDIPEDDSRRILPRFQGENFYKNQQLVQRIQGIAQRKKCTAGQICLAWMLAQGNDVIVIPGTKRIQYLEENVAAKDVHLSPEELAELRQLIDAAEVAGERYNEHSMQTLHG